MGIASRTDFDLKAHANHSGASMDYLDPFTNQRYIPYCVEPSLGADRVALAFLCDAYDEETLENGDVRNVLRLHPALAPFKAAVLPLQKNKLGEKAKEVHSMLARHFMVDYDDAGQIGKRYRREDEIGTPLCITIDFDTWRTRPSPSGTGIPWSRSVCPSASWRATSWKRRISKPVSSAHKTPPYSKNMGVFIAARKSACNWAHAPGRFLLFVGVPIRRRIRLAQAQDLF